MADAHDSGAAPTLPKIQDEAADTPMWLPITGVVVFLVGALWMTFQSIIPSDDASEGGATVQAVEAAPEEAPRPVAVPAFDPHAGHNH